MSNFVQKTKQIANIISSYKNNELIKSNTSIIIPSDLAKLDDDLAGIIETYNKRSNAMNTLNIGIMGAMKTGKSSAINTIFLQGKQFELPVASLPETASITNLTYSVNEQVEVFFYSKEEWDIITKKAKEYEVTKTDKNQAAHNRYTKAEEIPNLTDLLDKGFEIGDLNNLKNYIGADGKLTPIVKQVNIAVNNPLIQNINLTDTPGLEDPSTERSILTEEYMKSLDVVFFFSPIDQFLTETTIDYIIKLIGSGITKIYLIATRFDTILAQHNEVTKDFKADCEAIVSQIKQGKSELISDVKKKYANNPKTLEALDMISKFELFFYSSFWDRYKQDLPNEQGKRAIDWCLKAYHNSFTKKNLVGFDKEQILNVVNKVRQDTKPIKEKILRDFEKNYTLPITTTLQTFKNGIERNQEIHRHYERVGAFTEDKYAIIGFFEDKEKYASKIDDAFTKRVEEVTTAINEFVQNFDVTLYQRAKISVRSETYLADYGRFLGIFWKINKVYKTRTITTGDVQGTKNQLNDLPQKLNKLVGELLREKQEDAIAVLKATIVSIFKEIPNNFAAEPRKLLEETVIRIIEENVKSPAFEGVKSVDLSPFNGQDQALVNNPGLLGTRAEAVVADFIKKEKEAVGKYNNEWQSSMLSIKESLLNNAAVLVGDELSKIEKELTKGEARTKEIQELKNITDNCIYLINQVK